MVEIETFEQEMRLFGLMGFVCYVSHAHLYTMKKKMQKDKQMGNSYAEKPISKDFFYKKLETIAITAVVMVVFDSLLPPSLSGLMKFSKIHVILSSMT